MPAEPRYWFPAKRFGWGWGPPQTWDGWIALAALVALALAGALMFPPKSRLTEFLVYEFALCALFIAVCWRTGEPPRWRRGDE